MQVGIKKKNNKWAPNARVFMCVCVCVCMFVFVDVCIRMYVYVYTYMYTHTRTHTQAEVEVDADGAITHYLAVMTLLEENERSFHKSPLYSGST